MRATVVLLSLLLLPATISAQTADPPAVLVSRQAAEALHLAVGAVVQVGPADGSRGREFRVAGIYEPTPDPSRLGNAIYAVRLHLPDLLAMTSPPDAPKGASGAPISTRPIRGLPPPQSIPERCAKGSAASSASRSSMATA